MVGELRTRVLRRCCPRRASSAAAAGGSGGSVRSRVKFPETPLILAGALGGPFCIFFLTPLRNALTLASQDAESSAWELYQSVFHSGFSSGWTGGLAPVLPSCPQFCVMGPLFHFLKEALGSVAAAVCVSAIAETGISYGSQTLNAQLAFNREQLQTGRGAEVPLWNPLIPFGPGSTVHVARNIVALSGIRIFARPCQALIRRLLAVTGLGLPDGLRQFLGDFVASLGSAILSAPLNQCYNFAVTSQAYVDGTYAERAEELAGFLSRSYLVHDDSGSLVGLSPTLGRDLLMRCAYVATLYAIFSTIERFAVTLWKRRETPTSPQGPVRRTHTVGIKASAP